MAKSSKPEIYSPVSSILTPRKFFRTKLKSPQYVVDNKQRVKGKCGFVRSKRCPGNVIFFPKQKAKFLLLKKHWIG